MKQNNNVKKESGSKVLIIGNKCYRCGHEWIPENIDVVPKVCPKCKNPYWDRPRKEKNKNNKKQ
jgi:predicted Zn-ribbon and HTH transcriptional regulator